MKSLLLVAFLSALSFSANADFDYAAYKDALLLEVTNNLEIDRRANFYFETRHSKYRSAAIFTGKVRNSSSELKEYLSLWFKAHKHPDDYTKMYQQEIEVRQGGQNYWLPIQKQIIPYFLKEIAPGKEVNLYVLFHGALNHAPIFSVSEFDAKVSG